MLTIYTFKDGYKAIGAEGSNRYFLPPGNTHEKVIVEDLIKKELNNQAKIRYRDLNLTLAEYFRQ